MGDPQDLAGWLDYQLRLHPAAIELGLGRVREVWQRLGAPRPAPRVITVGGTNGKGSTVALLEAMLTAGGFRVGAYTSPHLRRYNERVRVAGAEAGDAELVAAFRQVEQARGDTALTYFEFGTLAALLHLASAELDIALLEVGLGGRLDAVNLIDADAAIVTTVDLDHQDYLGDSRDAIGREKAGIFRAGAPAILGDADSPRGLLEGAADTGAAIWQAGRDFHVRRDADGWSWQGKDLSLAGLPLPALAAPCQLANAAAAIAALAALRGVLGWNPEAIAHGLAVARAGARLQPLGGDPELILDVAHNPQAAAALAAWLAGAPPRPTQVVYGALIDKDVAGVAAALAPHVQGWHLAGLAGLATRGLTAEALQERIADVVPVAASRSDSVAAALARARGAAGQGGRVLAFGSFILAAEVLRLAGSDEDDHPGPAPRAV